MAKPGWLTCLLVLVVSSNYGYSINNFSGDDIKDYRERVRAMFQFAYDGYLRHAYPYDELQPLSCKGQNTWGSYSLTLVDALDTLAIMGNYTEFRRVANLLIRTLDFDKDINVSVFETNIRVVGGLLSAHLMSRRAMMVLEPGWPCTGPLLRLAEKAARKLLPAFETPTGMPYGTVNLLHGVPKGETTITCTAGVGTFLVEFGALSRLTGDPIFEEKAMRAMRYLYEARSPIGLVGNHINVETGKWTALDSGIGAGVDSYFEYLVKGAILYQYPSLMDMFQEHVSGIESHLKREDWYMWSHMRKGTITMPMFQSLEAFWPGLQSLVGDIDKGMKTIHNYHQVWKQFGFTPEFYNIPKAEPHASREGYPLRPELIESTMYLYHATKDPYLLELGVDILESIEHNCKTRCGYATVKDVRDHRLEDRMESFFLAETTKYLYLLFDPDNFIHNTGGSGTVINTPNGECIIEAGGYVFNTEAHPVDPAALYCCSAEKKKEDLLMQEFHDTVDLLALLGITPQKDDMFGKVSEAFWDSLQRKQFQGHMIPNGEGSPEGPHIPIVTLETGGGASQDPTAGQGQDPTDTQTGAQQTVDSKPKVTDFTNINDAVDWMLMNLQKLGGNFLQGNSAGDGRKRFVNLKDVIEQMQEEQKSEESDPVTQLTEALSTGVDTSQTEEVITVDKKTDSSESIDDIVANSVSDDKQSDLINQPVMPNSQTEHPNQNMEVSYGNQNDISSSSVTSSDIYPKIPDTDGTGAVLAPEEIASDPDTASALIMEDKDMVLEEEEEDIEEEEEDEYPEVCIALPEEDRAATKHERSRQERLLTCSAQPFHSRLSVMGEMFTTL